MRKAIARCRQLGAQRHRRLAHDQRGDQGGQHQQSEQHISAGPRRMLVGKARRAEALGEIQCTRCRQQCSDPVAGHIAGGQGSLLGVLGNFQAIGINGDVLRGGREGDHHSNRDQPREMLLRVAEAHADQAQNHQALGQHQPGPTTSQFAKQGQAPLVEQWRPDPFKGVGKADQARIADGLASDTGFAQPHG